MYYLPIIYYLLNINFSYSLTIIYRQVTVSNLSRFQIYMNMMNFLILFYYILLYYYNILFSYLYTFK